MTWLKLVAFLTEGVLTFVIVIAATLRIHDAPELYGWRGLVALSASALTVAVVVVLGIWSIVYRLSTKAHKDHDAMAPIERRPLSLQQNAGDAQ